MHEEHESIPGHVEQAGRLVLDAAFHVHDLLGPGLLESVYEHCLAEELIARGARVQRQTPIAVAYRDVALPIGFRIDLLVENSVVVEVKAVESLAPVHVAQVLTYLRFARRRLGYLLNFNTVRLKDGVRRVVL